MFILQEVPELLHCRISQSLYIETETLITRLLFIQLKTNDRPHHNQHLSFTRISQTSVIIYNYSQTY